MATKQKIEEVPVPSYTKEQILASSKYANNKDALSVILSESKTYTLDKVDYALSNFMERKAR